MAGPMRNPAPRSPSNRTQAGLAFQPPPFVQSKSEFERLSRAAADAANPLVDIPLVPRPLSNITEVTSQTIEDRGKENRISTAATDTDKSKLIRPHTADVTRSLSNVDTNMPRGDSSQRVRNADLTAEVHGSFRPNRSSSRSTSSTLAPPDDSASPLAAASGRVGTLLIQIHRNRSRALIYGQLFIVGALSHQTWVSGEVLFFDVEVYNSTEKSIKRVDLQLERITTLHPTVHVIAGAKETVPDATSEILAKWNWRKGEDGWCGIAPHTQAAKVWNPIVPASQATMSTHRFEVRYSLSIFVPCTFSKTASVQIPITVVSPNSLGASRLQQHLQHGLPAYSNGTSGDHNGSPPRRRESRRARKSSDQHRQSASSRFQDDDSKPKRSRDGRLEPNPNSIFMTSNPIPRASDELLSEMLQKLQESVAPEKLAQLSLAGGQHRKGLSAPIQSIPVMRPLSAIGAHFRRASSDDVRSKADHLQQNMLTAPNTSPSRASFDDDLLRPQHQRQRSRGLNVNHQQHHSRDGNTFKGLHEFVYGDSSSSLDNSDLDRFLLERRSFQIARRTSGNPFFKGATNKERLRSHNRHGYRAAKNRYDEYGGTGISDYGRYEFREAADCDQPTYDRPYFKSRAGGQHQVSSHPSWKQARTIF